MASEHDSLDIVSQAFCLAELVNRVTETARQFYYAVMLAGHDCPTCGGGLVMLKEGACRCTVCGMALDPTIAFQRCTACGGAPRLAIRRYYCARCGIDVLSRFLFDGLVFDAEYFRRKMIEYRESRVDQRERVRQMLAESRSAAIQPQPVDLTAVPGLLEALNRLMQTDTPVVALSLPPAFNLNRYEAHIQAHIGPIAVSLERIPPLGENRRLDRIWRFIAIVFLVHAGILDAWQDGPDVMVIKHETDPERHAIPGDLEETDGIERAAG